MVDVGVVVEITNLIDIYGDIDRGCTGVIVVVRNGQSRCVYLQSAAAVCITGDTARAVKYPVVGKVPFVADDIPAIGIVRAGTVENYR